MLRPPRLLSVIIRKAIIRRNPKYLPNLAPANQLPNLHAKREIPSPNSLHQKQLLLLSRPTQNLSLRRIDRERLLAQHMLPGTQDEHHVLEVVRVRGCDVHDVDVGVGRELLVGAIRSAGGWDACVCDEFLRAVLG